MAPPRTVLIDAFPDSAFRHREHAALACVDVMLATTTLVTAAAQGRTTRVAASLEEVRALAAGLEGAIVAGELAGAPPGTFEAADGPGALLQRGETSRPLVLASPPGTDLVVNAARPGPVLLACFRNLTATAAALAPQPRVALLAAGWHEELSCEDQMAAAWIAQRLVEQGFEAADRRTAEAIRRWSGISPALAGWGNSAAALRRAGRGDEVEFVLAHVDDLAQPCWAQGAEVQVGEAVDVRRAGGRER
ncbi:MAG TPA: 2-phosphosulfolactate phosphatase [Vicinamibacteria bacterium]|nr:2-phosphosulfolactate phosphatase [Vicinamibacteria bacterium]